MCREICSQNVVVVNNLSKILSTTEESVQTDKARFPDSENTTEIKWSKETMFQNQTTARLRKRATQSMKKSATQSMEGTLMACGYSD